MISLLLLYKSFRFHWFQACRPAFSTFHYNKNYIYNSFLFVICSVLCTTDLYNFIILRFILHATCICNYNHMYLTILHEVFTPNNILTIKYHRINIQKAKVASSMTEGCSFFKSQPALHRGPPLRMLSDTANFILIS